MVYSADLPLQFPEGVTISQFLLGHNINRTPLDSPAIIDGPTGQVVYTYLSFRNAVRTLATLLQVEVGLKRGDTACLLATNSVHYPVYVHAVLACGATLSALNPTYKSQELIHVLGLAKPKFVFCEPTLTTVLNEAISSTASAELCEPHVHTLSGTSWSDQPTLDHDKVASSQPPGAKSFKLPNDCSAGDVAFISFSSGTTGAVKGVKLSHRNIIANTFQHRTLLKEDWGHQPVFALVFPFFHILGLGVFVCQYLLQGYTTVVFPTFDFSGLVKSIGRDSVSHLNIVPTLAMRFLRDPVAVSGDYSSLKCLMNAAAPLKQDLVKELRKRLGCEVTQWYGMTEASPSVISQKQSQAQIPNAIGKLLSGMELRVIDENEDECQIGTPGELCLKGPNIMLGYVGDKQLNDAALTSDGFLRTGDIGFINNDGFVFLVDRAKEMIKVKGNQVAPIELESILLSHPAVKDAAVKGVYIDEIASEIPVGFFTTDTPRNEHEDLVNELMNLVNRQVARYKKISGGLFVISEIPRNASGKVLRRLLPEMPIKLRHKVVQESPKL